MRGDDVEFPKLGSEMEGSGEGHRGNFGNSAFGNRVRSAGFTVVFSRWGEFDVICPGAERPSEANMKDVKGGDGSS